MIYTLTFNPAIDYIVDVNSIVTGKVNRATHHEFRCGGKGINVSTMLNNLGHKSVALAFVAGFTGQTLEDMLRESFVYTDFIYLPSGSTRINLKIKDESVTEINTDGPAIPKYCLDILDQKLKWVDDGDIFILSGSIPSSLPTDTYEKILQQLKDKRVKLVVDATKQLLLKVLKYKPFLIKPNLEELSETLGKSFNSEQELFEACKYLQHLGAQNVLLSLGHKGAILLDSYGEFHRIDAPVGNVKNSVGAGDSMVAGFIAGYMKFNSYDYALKLAIASGSATTFSDTLATRKEVETTFLKLDA